MNYLNDPHYDVDEAQLDHFDQGAAKRQRYQLWKERLDQVELQIEKDEAAPDPDADLSPKKKRLKRQIKEEALLRLEEAARTEEDFAAVQYHWDRRDSNRERKERYHEVLRGDVPLDVGIAKNPHIFPEWLGTPVAQQMRSGNYLDWLANCPYEMHDLLADAVLSSLIYSLKEDHKENFYYSAIQLLQSQEVAKLMGQSTRNIRKKRNVILRKLRSGWYEYLRTKPAGSLSLDEKDFLRKYKKTAPDGFGSGKEVCYEAAV